MSAVGKNHRTTYLSGWTSRSALEKTIQYIPGQLVVHADPDDVIGEVEALIAWKRDARCRVEIRFVLQPDVEILDLCRPVLREFDLDASARRPAPMPLIVGYLTGSGGNAVVDVGDRPATGGIQQPIVVSVADPSAEGRKPTLLDLVAEDGVGREFSRASLFSGGRDVPLEAEDHRTVLKIESGGDANDAAAQIHARSLVGPAQLVAYDRLAPGATAGNAEIGAAPGCDRGRRRLVDGRNAEVSSTGGRGHRQRQD